MRYYFQTFTVSIADPAVFTRTDHDLSIGDAIIFETTGALPTGLTVDIDYYVVRKGYSSSTFKVSTEDDPEGASVITTGTQSGTHTMMKVSRDKITFSQRLFK
jgi:hypothetical protein